MSEVREDFKKTSKFEWEEQLGQAIYRLHDLFREAKRDGDIRAALAIQKEISETLGLKAPAKLEHEAGENLHDWLKKQATTWPAEGEPPNGGKPDSGPDPEAIPKSHNC